MKHVCIARFACEMKLLPKKTDRTLCFTPAHRHLDFMKILVAGASIKCTSRYSEAIFAVLK